MTFTAVSFAEDTNCESLFKAVGTAKKLFPMNPDYKNETTLGLPSRLSGRSANSTRLVKYFSPAEKEKYKIKFKTEGDQTIIADFEGKPLNLHFDTFGKEKAIYVIDEFGDMYILPTPVEGVYHHSSLTNGESVQAAGEILIKDGRPIRFTNNSGHYHPPKESLDFVLEFFRKNKVVSPTLQAQKNTEGLPAGLERVVLEKIPTPELNLDDIMLELGR